MLFDLPAVACGDREVMAPALARGDDQLAHVRLGAPAMVVDDVQHAAHRRLQRELQPRGLAQRAQRIVCDVALDHCRVMGMTRDEQREVALRELALAAFERAAARMHDERVVGENVAPAGARGAQAEVVLLAVAGAEDRIERAERIDRRAAHEHAEAHAGRQIGIRGNCGVGERLPRRLGVALRRPGVVFAQPRERADLGVVGERRHRSDARVRRGAAHERVEPAVGDDRVGVEQHDVGTRGRHAAVGRRGEAEVPIVSRELDPRVAQARVVREALGHAGVARAVVDQQQAKRSARAAQDARDAAREVVRRIEHRHDDVDGCSLRHQAARIRFHSRRARSHGSTSHQRTLSR